MEVVRCRGIRANKQCACGALSGAGSGSEAEGIETILLGEINTRLGEPHDEHEEELGTSLSDYELEDVTRQFTSSQGYRVWGLWTQKMHREGRKVTGRGEYVLGTAHREFKNMGLQDPRIPIDHRMMLSVISG